MSQTPNLTFTILNSYYSNVRTLQMYLREVLLPPDGSAMNDHAVIRPTDSSKYIDFVTKSYVAYNVQDMERDPAILLRYKTFEPLVSMREIIDRAQEKLMKSMKTKSLNVLTSGYRLANKQDDRAKIGMSRLGVSNYFVNTIITALQGPEWERLLKRIGEDAMFHLLTETCIFVPLPNDCLCQMTGYPIVSRNVPASAEPDLQAPLLQSEQSTGDKRSAGDLPDHSSTKRARMGEAKPSQVGASRMPSDIMFARSRLFYSRPSFVLGTKIIVAGLPPRHVLNIIRPSYGPQSTLPAEDAHAPKSIAQQMEHARHLSKYIFPRQYGLANAFTPTAQPKWLPHKLPDYADREHEIKGQNFKTPKRLKSTLQLLEKMIWRHGKCHYRALRDMACPSHLKHDTGKELDSSVILEWMSEESIHLRSQPSMNAGNISVDTSGNTIMPMGLTQAEAAAKNKPRFAEFACSHTEVFRYAVLVTKAVIPDALWGSKANFKKAMKSVKDFIVYRRYEAMSLHQVIQNLSINDCQWLVPDGEGNSKSKHVPLTDSLKRRELLEEFLFWYFGSFLLPLLRTTFYVTESSAFRNRTLYFRHDDWHTLCTPLIDRLTTETFLKLEKGEAEEILRQRRLGSSFVRLLPKDTGVRPIVNLSRKKIQQTGFFTGYQQSINDILQAAFQILTYEKDHIPDLIGSSVFGPNEIHCRLKAFKTHLLSESPTGHLPKLYFVKVDVQACFDTIEQTKLLQILKDAISEDMYMLQRYGQVTQTAGRIQRRFVKKATPGDEHPHFIRHATQLAGLLRHAIFVDQVVYPLSAKKEVLELLEEHITENVVKIGQDYYRQAVGIPQGSVLSALLCSIFYGDLEREHLQFTHDPKSLLLRLIDDYLFITTDLSKARKFLTVMNKGHPEYGSFVSKDKTLTNFDYDAQIMNVTGPSQKAFPWCACLINMSDLSVTADYSRYHESYLTDSLTVGRGKRAGATFVHKMLQQVKTKTHHIYCDTGLNPERVVYFNIYQNFLLVAMKMHHYLRSWGLNVAKNAAFVQKTIDQVIDFAYVTICAKVSRNAEDGRKRRLDKNALRWLGIKAFYTVFSHKPTAYKPILSRLHFQLCLRRNKTYSGRFRELAHEGNIMVVQLSF